MGKVNSHNIENVWEKLNIQGFLNILGEAEILTIPKTEKEDFHSWGKA